MWMKEEATGVFILFTTAKAFVSASNVISSCAALFVLAWPGTVNLVQGTGVGSLKDDVRRTSKARPKAQKGMSRCAVLRKALIHRQDMSCMSEKKESFEAGGQAR